MGTREKQGKSNNKNKKKVESSIEPGCKRKKKVH